MAYTSDDGTYAYIRKLMALPFLPHTEISPMLTRLKVQATTEQLQDLVGYITDTWIDSRTWPPQTWSVFMQPVRTNNDVEGWHNSLNRRASGRCQLPFYMLVNLLHREAKLTAIKIRLVSELKLKRIQRRKYRNLQRKMFTYWDEYWNYQRTAAQFLKACSYLNGPVRV